MTSNSLVSLAILAGLFVPMLRAERPVNIHINNRRPLETALNELEKTLGVPINYEDPRFECPADIEDVTDKVQSAAQRAANPRARIMVPKGGPLGLDAIMRATSPTVSDILPLVTLLRVQHEASGYPGRFTVNEVASVATVEPTAVRASDCTWKSSVPAMETHIGFPSEPRSASETLSLILNTLSQRLGIKVGLGSVAVLDFVNRTVTLGAADEPANLALMHLFEQVSGQNVAPMIGHPYYSYHLLYDPGLKYYLLHISAVRPMMTEIKPNATAPAPVQGTFGFKKTVKQ